MLSDSLHTWQWLASRSSSSAGKVLGRLAPVGPAAGFAGGSAVGEHAFPRVPVTAHVQQGKETFGLCCPSWRWTKLLENEDSSLCASVFTFLAFCGIQVPDTLDLGCCSRALVGGVGS